MGCVSNVRQQSKSEGPQPRGAHWSLAAWGCERLQLAGMVEKETGIPLLPANDRRKKNRSRLLRPGPRGKTDGSFTPSTIGDFFKPFGTLAPEKLDHHNLLKSVRIVVALWSPTSPYHFSSPAIDYVSVGRRTDKGMCMTLPTDTADTASETESLR